MLNVCREEEGVMQQVGLEFAIEDRCWSPDHGSIQFSAKCEGMEVRFFMPRACLKALRQPSEAAFENSYIEVFDNHVGVVIDAARLVFAKDGGYSKAYVITDDAIDAAQCLLPPVIQHLAA